MDLSAIFSGLQEKFDEGKMPSAEGRSSVRGTPMPPNEEMSSLIEKTHPNIAGKLSANPHIGHAALNPQPDNPEHPHTIIHEWLNKKHPEALTKALPRKSWRIIGGKLREYVETNKSHHPNEDHAEMRRLADLMENGFGSPKPHLNQAEQSVVAQRALSMERKPAHKQDIMQSLYENPEARHIALSKHPNPPGHYGTVPSSRFSKRRQMGDMLEHYLLKNTGLHTDENSAGKFIHHENIPREKWSEMSALLENLPTNKEGLAGINNKKLFPEQLDTEDLKTLHSVGKKYKEALSPLTKEGFGGELSPEDIQHVLSSYSDYGGPSEVLKNLKLYRHDPTTFAIRATHGEKQALAKDQSLIHGMNSIDLNEDRNNYTGKFIREFRNIMGDENSPSRLRWRFSNALRDARSNRGNNHYLHSLALATILDHNFLGNKSNISEAPALQHYISAASLISPDEIKSTMVHQINKMRQAKGAEELSPEEVNKLDQTVDMMNKLADRNRLGGLSGIASRYPTFNRTPAALEWGQAARNMGRTLAAHETEARKEKDDFVRRNFYDILASNAGLNPVEHSEDYRNHVNEMVSDLLGHDYDKKLVNTAQNWTNPNLQTVPKDEFARHSQMLQLNAPSPVLQNIANYTKSFALNKIGNDPQKWYQHDNFSKIVGDAKNRLRKIWGDFPTLDYIANAIAHKTAFEFAHERGSVESKAFPEANALSNILSNNGKKVSNDTALRFLHILHDNYWNEGNSIGEPDYNSIHELTSMMGPQFGLDINQPDNPELQDLLGHIAHKYIHHDYESSDEPRGLGIISNVQKKPEPVTLKKRTVRKSAKDLILEKKKKIIDGTYDVEKAFEEFAKSTKTPAENMRTRIFKSTLRYMISKQLGLNEDLDI